MKHGAKNRSNTRKIFNNNNVHTHTRSHQLTHPPTHTHALLFWLTNNLKHSINYNKTKFLKQQNTKIETLNRPQHINYRQHLWSNILNPGSIRRGFMEVDHFALRPQKRGGLLGTGTGGWGGGGGGDERVKARPQIPPEKDRRPPPEQWKR